jgi:hypothetical protein
MKRLTFVLIDVLGKSAEIDYLLVILRCVQLCDLRKGENTFSFESRCCKKSHARDFGAPLDFDFEISLATSSAKGMHIGKIAAHFDFTEYPREKTGRL